MKALLMRTDSIPVLQNRFTAGGSSWKVLIISRHNSVESLSSYGERFAAGKFSIDVKDNVGMRRVLSENDFIRSERMLMSVGSKPSPAKIPEDDETQEDEEEIRFSDGRESLIWKESGIPVEEQGSSGGGSGYSGGNGDGNGGGGYDDRSKIRDYYREMLKSNPNNSLLLMNYGKFLYEVEKDSERAEEYYERAQRYFDQAVNASPDDCMVLGSYAHFMWEVDDDEEELMAASPAMVSAV